MSIRLARTLLLAALSACSGISEPPIGQLRLGLSSGLGELRYKLGRASFAVAGAAELTLESEDDPAADVLERSLPEGDYSVHLLDGWQLERLAPGGSELVTAELTSDNPLPFSILPGELTTVVFQFRTLGVDAREAGGGDLRIAIAVDGASAPLVVFSELMKNPESLPDADGEWLELFNAGSEAVDLGGCSLARGDQDLTFEGEVPLAAGAYLTLANGEAPGFVPDVLYSGLTLPNSGAFVLRLACGEQLLDEVSVETSVPAQRAGRSLSLSSSASSATQNDDPSSWCEGSSSYNGDFGTPGTANPVCPS
jgi:hypothetical protein